MKYTIMKSISDFNMKLLVILSLMSSVMGEDTPKCMEFYLRPDIADIKANHVNSTVKNLLGTWTSPRCETRAGPEYILRRYTFQKGTYELVQHQYWDHLCYSPKLTIISEGHVTVIQDWDNSDFLASYLNTVNITIIPQDVKAVQQLDSITTSHCPGHNWKPWRLHEENRVFSALNNLTITPFRKFNSLLLYDVVKINYVSNKSNIISTDTSCLGPILWTYNEIRRFKLRVRPHSKKINDDMRWELLLGGIPSKLDRLEDYSPTDFQIPLVKHYKEPSVPIIRYKGKNYLVDYDSRIGSGLIEKRRVPPDVPYRFSIPPFIVGEWVSEKCEISRWGLFLRRYYIFYDHNYTTRRRWIGQHRVYSDPFCAFHVYTLTLSGTYTTSARHYINSLPDVFEISYIIYNAWLVIFNQHMVDSMGLGTCGKNFWKIGVSQDLGPTNGCPKLGLKIGSKNYWMAVIKEEMHHEGYWLLFMGQVDNNNLVKNRYSVLTDFQPPLFKCKNGHIFVDGHYEEPPSPESPNRLFDGHLALVFSPLLGLENFTQIV